MAITLRPAIAPTHLKLGLFGEAATGKTYTAALVMSQFIAKFCKGKSLAMFDTESGSGYVKNMVEKITGKELLVIHSHNFRDLVDFADLCREEGHVALLDSATHPWRSLVDDYLEAKKSRVIGAGGNPQTVRLSLKDWGPIKQMWSAFSEKFCYDPVHWCMTGREGDRWESVEDDEGNEELKKTGVKMKTETETGYEPSLLVQLLVEKDIHYAVIKKDRSDTMKTGLRIADPCLESFLPHINTLSFAGNAASLSKTAPVFEPGTGKNERTIQTEREGILENIKDDITLAIPNRDTASQKRKIEVLREAFGTSSWTEIQKNDRKFTPNKLKKARIKIQELLKGESENGKDSE